MGSHASTSHKHGSLESFCHKVRPMSKKDSLQSALTSRGSSPRSIDGGDGPVLVFRRSDHDLAPFSSHNGHHSVGHEEHFQESTTCSRCNEYKAVSNGLCTGCLELHNSLARIASESTKKEAPRSHISMSMELDKYPPTPPSANRERTHALPGSSLLEELMEEVQQISDPQGVSFINNQIQRQDILSPMGVPRVVSQTPHHSSPSLSQVASQPHPRESALYASEHSKSSLYAPQEGVGTTGARQAVHASQIHHADISDLPLSNRPKPQFTQYHKASSPSDSMLRTLEGSPLSYSRLPAVEQRAASSSVQVQPDVDGLLQDLLAIEEDEPSSILSSKWAIIGGAVLLVLVSVGLTIFFVKG